MQNKLGLNIEMLSNVERQIVGLKMNLIDEFFVFDENIFSLDYLSKLHHFLFSDIYYDDELCIKKMSEVEKDSICFTLNKIKEICLSDEKNIDKLLDLICDIWYFQPFCDGNTRTLMSYLKILNYAFLFDINIDLNNKIESGPSMFKKENFVNQKRLTKY